MTTESKQDTRTGLTPLLGALGAGAGGVLALVVAAAIAVGQAAVVGAAVGGVLTLPSSRSGSPGGPGRAGDAAAPPCSSPC